MEAGEWNGKKKNVYLKRLNYLIHSFDALKFLGPNLSQISPLPPTGLLFSTSYTRYFFYLKAVGAVMVKGPLHLVFLDCGITASLGETDHEKFMQVFTAVVKGEVIKHEMQ